MKKLLLWLLVLASAGMIYLFSAQEASVSNQVSGRVVKAVIRIAEPDYHRMPAELQRITFSRYDTIVRKIAHFTEFLLLGLGLSLLLYAYGLKYSPLWACILGGIYACLDEFHQYFVDGRAMRAHDALIDGMGLLCGAALAGLIMLRRRAKKASASRETEEAPAQGEEA